MSAESEETNNLLPHIPSHLGIKPHILELLQKLDIKGAYDEDITEIFEKVSDVIDWDDLKDYLQQSIEHHLRPEILNDNFRRTVKVYKDSEDENGKKVFHSTYDTEDTVLLMILRRSPPKDVIDLLREICPVFSHSKDIFDLIDKMSGSVQQIWAVVEDLLDMAKKEYSPEDARAVVMIRHTWREETLLSVASRRDPPFSTITKILNLAPEANSIRDTPKYNWYPFVYNLAYPQTEPEVTKALIPPPERIGNYMTELDVYDMTPLHWALHYGTPTKSIELVVNADTTKNSLSIEDKDKLTPYQFAMRNGADVRGDTLRAIVPDGSDINALSIDVLKRWWKNKDPMSVKTFPNLADLTSKNQDLQNVVRSFSSERIPIAIFISELYVNILFLIAYNRLTRDQLHGSSTMNNKEKTRLCFILIMCVIYVIFREFNQCRSSGFTYFASPWNWIDKTHIIYVLISLFMMLSGRTGGKAFHDVTMITLSVLWIKTIIFVRALSMPFAVFVSGMLHVIKKLFPFIIATSMVLIGFSQLYVIESIGDGRCEASLEETNEFCESWSSLQTVYSMFIDGVDINGLAITPAMLVISSLFGFIVAILLLNIVIAIVNDSWSSVYANGKVQYWKNRFDFLEEARGLKSLFMAKKGAEDSSTTKDLIKSRLLINSRLAGIDNDDCFLSTIMDKICKALWPRDDYWGYFPDIIVRVCCPKPSYGSFGWQFRYEMGATKNPMKKFRIVMKAILLVFVFSLYLLLLAIIGLLTCGYLWPLSIRRAIFGFAVISREDRTVVIDRPVEINKQQMKTLEKIAQGNEQRVTEVTEKLVQLKSKLEENKVAEVTEKLVQLKAKLEENKVAEVIEELGHLQSKLQVIF